MSMNRLAALFAALSLAVPALAGQGTDPLVPGELMLRAETPKALASALATLSTSFTGVGVVQQIDGRPIYLVNYQLNATQVPDDVNLVLDAMVAQGRLTWAELNYAGQTGEGRTDSLWLSGLGIGFGQFQNQYAAPLLGLNAAHARSRGAGVVIAVLDTGIDGAHPSLAGAVSPQGVSFVPGSSQWSDAGDGRDSDGDGLVDEQVGHGTFVAGLIRLVAPDATLLPVRVLDSDGIANNFQIARAVAWSIDRGAHVVNMSLGEDYESITIADVVAEARTKGVVVVGAAGNRATDDPKEYPASDPNAIGVTALDWNDARAPFANFGNQLDLAAPGDSIVMGPGADLARSIIGPVPGGGYGIWEGTSFATAFVSGTAALVRAQHPEWPSKAVPRGAIVDTILTTLATTGVDTDAQNPEFAGQLGDARISASAAAAAGPIAPRRGDINLDGFVGAPDLAALLNAWGPVAGAVRADLNASGSVDAQDLAILLSLW
jgi:subtilisin family serine protease